jgi:hypothetical protein
LALDGAFGGEYQEGKEETAMTTDITTPAVTAEDAYQQYVRELDSLVAAKAPDLRPPEEDRVLLGSLSELAPSRPPSADLLTGADQTWLSALQEVAHRHGVSYELITHEDGEDHLWLVPRH